MSFKIYNYTPAVQSAIDSTIQIAFNRGLIGNIGSGSTLIGTTPISSGINNSIFGYAALANNKTGSNNTAVGTFSLTYQNNSGNTAIGSKSLVFKAGNNNTVVGYQESPSPAIPPRNNITAIGYNSENTIIEDNEVRIGNNTIGRASVHIGWTVTSDERLKSEIKDLDVGLDFITQVRPVSYYRSNNPDKKIEFGVIAQELENALKNNNISNSGIINEDGEGFLGVRYNDFIAILIKSTQELRSIVEKQQKEIEELENIIKNHQESIDKLNSNLS